MLNVAILVDAGYLYMGGAIALTGSAQNRENMLLKRPETIAKLKATAKEKTHDAPLLRIYWYDGLLRGQLSQEQQGLAGTDNVKVRLGAVTAGQQKGVDSLIVTDLIELARNDAISDAVLLSGDEDLRVGVQIAQSFGVRVHLVGIVPSRGNQSRLLIHEADTTTEWNKEDIEEILSVKNRIEPDSEESSVKAGASGNGDDLGEILDQVAAEIVNSIGNNEITQLAETFSQNPQWIPPEYDKRLLSVGGDRIGGDLGPFEKRRVRDKFKEIVKTRC